MVKAMEMELWGMRGIWKSLELINEAFRDRAFFEYLPIKREIRIEGCRYNFWEKSQKDGKVEQK